MGSMFLEGIRAEVRLDLKNRSDTGFEGLSDARLNLYINAAYAHVAHPSVHRHRAMLYTFTISLVNGTNQYTFHPTPEVAPVQIVALRSVTHLESTTLTATARRTKLRPKDPQWFDKRTITSGGVPRTCAVEGNVLVIEPVPGAAQNGQLLFLRAYREPSFLVDGQQTALQVPWDEVILLGAVWRAQLHFGYRQLAEATKLDYAALINEYRAQDDFQGEDWDWMVDVRTESTMEVA